VLLGLLLCHARPARRSRAIFPKNPVGRKSPKKVTAAFTPRPTSNSPESPVLNYVLYGEAYGPTAFFWRAGCENQVRRRGAPRPKRMVWRERRLTRTERVLFADLEKLHPAHEKGLSETLRARRSRTRIERIGVVMRSAPRSLRWIPSFGCELRSARWPVSLAVAVLRRLKLRCWGTTAYLRPGLSTARSGIRIPRSKASEQLRDFDGRDVRCPECEGGRWANTGPKKKPRALRGSSFGANMGRYVSIKTAYESRLNALRASVLLTYPSRPFRRRPCRHGHALRPSEPRQPSPRS